MADAHVWARTLALVLAGSLALAGPALAQAPIAVNEQAIPPSPNGELGDTDIGRAVGLIRDLGDTFGSLAARQPGSPLGAEWALYQRTYTQAANALDGLRGGGRIVLRDLPVGRAAEASEDGIVLDVNLDGRWQPDQVRNGRRLGAGDWAALSHLAGLLLHQLAVGDSPVDWEAWAQAHDPANRLELLAGEAPSERLRPLLLRFWHIQDKYVANALSSIGAGYANGQLGRAAALSNEMHGVLRLAEDVAGWRWRKPLETVWSERVEQTSRLAGSLAPPARPAEAPGAVPQRSVDLDELFESATEPQPPLAGDPTGAGLQAEIAVLREDVTALRAGIDELSGETRDLRTGIESVQGDVGTVRNAMDNLTGETEDLRANVEVLTTDTGTLRDEVETLRDGTDTLAGETEALGANVLALNGEAQSLRTDLTSVQSSIGTLRQGTAALAGQTQALRADVLGLNGEAQSLRTDVTNVRGEISTLRQDTAHLAGETQALRSGVQAMEGETKAVRAEMTAVLNEAGTLRQDMGALATETASLRTDVQRLDGQTAGVRDDLAAVQSEVGNLRQDTTALSDETKTLRTGVQALEGEAAAVRLDILSLGGETKLLRTDIEALSQDRTVQAEQQQALTQDLQDLALQVDTLNAAVAEQGRQIDSLAQAAMVAGTIPAALDTLGARQAALERQIADLTRQVGGDGLAGGLAEVQAVLASQEARSQDLERRLEARLQDRIRAVRQELEGLRQQARVVQASLTAVRPSVTAVTVPIRDEAARRQAAAQALLVGLVLLVLLGGAIALWVHGKRQRAAAQEGTASAVPAQSVAMEGPLRDELGRLLGAVESERNRSGELARRLSEVTGALAESQDRTRRFEDELAALRTVAQSMGRDLREGAARDQAMAEEVARLHQAIEAEREKAADLQAHMDALKAATVVPAPSPPADRSVLNGNGSHGVGAAGDRPDAEMARDTVLRETAIDALQHGDLDGFARALAQLTSLPLSVVQDMVREPSGHDLGLACRAADIAKAHFAAVLILNRRAQPASEQRAPRQIAEALARFDETSAHAASQALEAWRARAPTAESRNETPFG